MESFVGCQNSDDGLQDRNLKARPFAQMLRQANEKEIPHLVNKLDRRHTLATFFLAQTETGTSWWPKAKNTTSALFRTML